MTMIPLFFYFPFYSSFSGMPTPLELSRGLLSCAFLPSPPACSVPLAFLCTCTGHCRTEKSCGSFSSAFFPEQLVAASFPGKSKKVTMTYPGRKMLLCFTLLRRWHRKCKVGTCSHGNHRRVVARCQCWCMLCIPGWVGHWCLRDG